MLKELPGFIGIDISNESWRSYVYIIDGEEVVYSVPSPVTLYMKETDTDSHRVVDDEGVCHYIGSTLR